MANIETISSDPNIGLFNVDLRITSAQVIRHMRIKQTEAMPFISRCFLSIILSNLFISLIYQGITMITRTVSGFIHE